MNSTPHALVLPLALALVLGSAGAALAGPSGGPVHLGDFNADSVSDVLLADKAANKAAIWIMDGDAPGTVQEVLYQDGTTGVGEAGDFLVPSDHTVAGVGSFGNGTTTDNYADLVLLKDDGSEYVIWFWGPGQTVTGSRTIAIAPGWSYVGIADLDGDGYRDDVLVQSGLDLGVYTHGDDGNLATAGFLATLPSATWEIRMAGNLDRGSNPGATNGDDLVLADTSDDSWAIWFIDNASLDAANSGTKGTTTWDFIGAKAFDNSGTANDDIVLQDSGGNLYLWFMGAAGAVDSGKQIGTSALDAKLVSAFGGPNRSDILLQEPDVDANEDGINIMFLDSNGDAAAAEVQLTPGVSGSDYQVSNYAVGDL